MGLLLFAHERTLTGVAGGQVGVREVVAECGERVCFGFGE